MPHAGANRREEHNGTGSWQTSNIYFPLTLRVVREAALGVVLAAAQPAGAQTAGPIGSPPTNAEATAAAPAEPPSAFPAVVLDEVTIVAQRLQAISAAIEPQIGASTYTVTSRAIEAQPRGENSTLNEVLLQTPGVSQDAQAAGGIHVRNEMQPVEYRINGIMLPAGLSFFGQGLSPRFARSFDLITGALPAQYGLATSGIIDIETKDGLFASGGSISMYGGSNATLHPGLEYGGSVDGYNFYVAGDVFSTNRGIDAVTPALTQTHDQSSQQHAFAYLDKVIDAQNRLTLVLSQFGGHFEIPDNPNTPPFPGIGFLNGIPVSAYNAANLDERQTEASQFAVLSYLHSDALIDVRVSAFTKQSSLDFRHDPTLADIAFNGIAQDASLRSFANGVQLDVSVRVTPDHTLRSGLLIQGERFSSNTTSRVLVQDGTDTSGNSTFGSTPGTSVPSQFSADIVKTGWTYSTWLQDEWKLRPDLTINYGGRFDVVNQFVMGNQLSPRLNAVWQATPATTVHAGYANLFTPPPFQLGPPANLLQFNNFNGTGLTTSGATPSTGNSPLKIERANLFDVGATQSFFGDLKIGIDGYYKFARDGVDFGQFGAPIITIPFNYRIVANPGIELTTSYQHGGFSCYGNLAIARQRAKGIASGEFNFAPSDLVYVDAHGIETDHSQLMTASAGVSYLWQATHFSLDLIAGTGARTTRPGAPINGASLPSWEQVNLGVTHRIEFPATGAIKLQFDVINVFDEVYLLRSSTSLGAFSPAYAPRRTFFAGLTKEF